MDMREDFFISSQGTKKIKYYIFTPNSEPVGVVQLCHGMCEYILRYREFCEFLTKNGWAVVGNDHLGHGYTAAANAEQGFFSEHNGWRFLVKDVKTVTDIAKKEFAGKPLVLMGHSMGSFIARCYTSWYGDALDGAIYMGTSSGLPKGLTEAAIKVAEAIKGDKEPLVKTQLALFSYMSRSVKNRKSDFDWITRDEAKIEKYKTDPLGSFAFTSSAFSDMVTLLNNVSNVDWAYSVPKKLPVLLISGEDDAIGDYGKGIKRVYGRLKRAGVTDVSIKLYEGARHELINEINRTEVYNDILAWLKLHFK